MTTEQRPSSPRWLRSRSSLVFLGFLAVAAFFLVTEHRAHLFGALPYLLLLLCPVLHWLLHRGGGDGHAGHGGQPPEGGQQ